MAEMKARPAQRSADEYMAGAMSMEATNFLPYFREKHPKLCASYESLAAKEGMKEEFEGNPLIFILSNEPRCCVHVAREFVDMREAEKAEPHQEVEQQIEKPSMKIDLEGISRSTMETPGPIIEETGIAIADEQPKEAEEEEKPVITQASDGEKTTGALAAEN